jgi:uncharacterized protein
METDGPGFVRLGSGLLIPRRAVLRGGLASLATVMVSRTLIGCSPPAQASDAASTDAALRDAPLPTDAGPVDGGPTSFPTRTVPDRPALRSLIADIGPLGEPDANGLRLPPGFTSRIIGERGVPVGDTGYEWHIFPDGGATYITEDNGWIYACNSEMIGGIGGVSAVRFDSAGEITAAYRILEGTSTNCAGGRTPWHTWLSCEEHIRGRVYECDPWGEHPPIVRPALGIFRHEAAAIDHDRGHVYLTEDESEGRLYRFVPTRLTAEGHPDLTEGSLEVAFVSSGGAVTWAALPDPAYTGELPTRKQMTDSTAFRGGEGVWYHEGTLYFATKGDNRVWAYDCATSMLSVLYDASLLATPPLLGVDNLTVSCCGDVLVAEDGGSMQVVAILPTGDLIPLVQVVDHPMSEITGPAFDPSGTRLYFSSQRSPLGGTTYEITGPFHEPA